MDRKVLACMLVVGLVSILGTVATLTWLSDTENIPFSLEVKTAELDVSPNDITFPNAAPGESQSVDITVTNNGDVTLTVTITGSGEWLTFTMPADFDLASGGEHTVTITVTVNDGYSVSGGTLSGTITVEGVQKP